MPMSKIIALLCIGLLLFMLGTFSKAETISIRKVNFSPLGLRDPFISVLPEKRAREELKVPEATIVEAMVSPPDISIQGIVWGGKFPQVIINGQVMKEGQVLPGPAAITILSIKAKEVSVLFRGKIFNLQP